MTISPLSVENLNSRLRQEPGIDADWFVPHMRDYLAYDADGCLALKDGSKTVGMITAVAYQQVGWLGWLYVDEKHRGQGCGEQLMRQGVGYLISRGMRSIVLEAVEQAVSLYKRVGFSEQFYTQHYSIEADRFRPQETGGIVAAPFRMAQFEQVAAFDARFFNQDRRRALGIAAVNQNFSGYVAHAGKTPAGYLFMSEATDSRQAGPLIVDAAAGEPTQILSALVSAAFDESDKRLHIRCPQVHPERSRPLMEVGAREVDYRTVRMFLGDLYQIEAPGTLSLGCPGRG